MADKEEVESTAEAGSSELSGPSQTSADLKTSPTGTNGSEAATDEKTRQRTRQQWTRQPRTRRTQTLHRERC